MDDPATAGAKAAEAIAKTTGQALEIVHDTGGYLRQVFGEVPADLVGVLGGAWLHERHIRLRDALRRRTEQILQDRDVQEAIELSPNMAAALIAGAQEEGREDLMELWARLLANAMDPNLNNVRQSFIDAVKKMDPLDAKVLKWLADKNLSIIRYQHRSAEPSGCNIGDLADGLQRHIDDIHVSLEHLKEIGFFYSITIQLDSSVGYAEDYIVTATNREFMRACYPEIGVT
jgi:hypothetical protein